MLCRQDRQGAWRAPHRTVPPAAPTGRGRGVPRGCVRAACLGHRADNKPHVVSARPGGEMPRPNSHAGGSGLPGAAPAPRSECPFCWLGWGRTQHRAAPVSCSHEYGQCLERGLPHGALLLPSRGLPDKGGPWDPGARAAVCWGSWLPASRAAQPRGDGESLCAGSRAWPWEPPMGRPFLPLALCRGALLGKGCLCAAPTTPRGCHARGAGVVWSCQQ